MNLLTLFFLLTPQIQSPDTAIIHKVPAVTISAPLKNEGKFSEQPVAASSLSIGDIESNRIIDTKSLSLLIPNFSQADYGSKMTSSIYIRGIGSRMDQPAMGLYVDNIPILNKNNYDFDFFDTQKIDILRGPQGTLYGRNTIGGVIDIHTLSPFNYQGSRIQVGYGNGNTSKIRASSYHKPSDDFAFSIALNHQYSDGFFINEYDNSDADRILSESGRLKIQFNLSPQWKLENILYANFMKQKGFAYSLYDPHSGKPSINHNDPCSYERFGLTDGLTFRYDGIRFKFSSTTSYQYTHDDMALDQDFLPLSMFTLNQVQHENAFTQEFIVRSLEEKRLKWIFGAFSFYKHLNMNAPVTFKKDGIDELILANANKGIHTLFPDDDLRIREKQFPIENNFILPAFGISLYHQSTFSTGQWKFTAGIRTDYEHTSIQYSNFSGINYRFTLTMPEYKWLPIEMHGEQSKSFFEIMPKIAAMYETGPGNIYATIARGYKAGGYNTQIFSDIVQNKLMGNIMSDLGIYFGDSKPDYNAESSTYYKPEYSWNYEVGGHFEFFDEKLFFDAALFYIDLTNQQLTVFPPGKTTGRLMSNAGQTKSFGLEISVNYYYKKFRLAGNYGHTHAQFIEFNNGNEDFSGKHVPYAPLNTFSTLCEYKLNLSQKWVHHILFNIGFQGVGKIYWNEKNSLSQPFYGLLNASVAMKKKNFTLGIWGRNLSGTTYHTFYFKSVGNSFVQQGKPIQVGIFINFNI